MRKYTSQNTIKLVIGYLHNIYLEGNKKKNIKENT